MLAGTTAMFHMRSFIGASLVSASLVSVSYEWYPKSAFSHELNKNLICRFAARFCLPGGVGCYTKKKWDCEGAVGNPHRAQICQFELFELILLLQKGTGLVQFVSLPDFSTIHRFGSVRMIICPVSTRFGLRFSGASWLGHPVGFGSLPRPVPAGSKIKRFGSVRPVRFGFLLLPVIETRQTIPSRAIRGRGISVDSTPLAPS